MRLGTLVLGLTLVFVMTTGYSDCDPGGRSHDTPAVHEDEAKCGPCKIEIHFNNECDPISASGASMKHAHANPRERVCFINDTECSFRLNFPDALFGADHNEITLAPGGCEVLQIDKQAARKTLSYTITCDCKGRKGGSGNPDFNVGGGGGGGG